MKVLLIKTSSIGDIIHTLPALTDAAAAIPNLSIDWVVEKNFAVIPTWHPAVANVIPVTLRRDRKNLLAASTWQNLRELKRELSSKPYDVIIDAQSLLKTAWLGYLAQGERVGLDFQSAREGLASLFYQRKCTVNFYQHAVVRMRELFSLALKYDLPKTAADFGLKSFRISGEAEKYLVFLHGTTWRSKEWPIHYWQTLAKLASAAGYQIKMSGVSEKELNAAREIALANDNVHVLPNLTIAEMGILLSKASGVVAVDTGLGHLASAFDVPTVSLYGSTNAEFTGAIGKASECLSAKFPCSPCLRRECTFDASKEPVYPPCYATIPPEYVWERVVRMLGFRFS